MDFGALAMYAAEAINCLTKLYENLLDDTEEVKFRLRVLGTDSRQLETFDPGRAPLHGGYSSKVPEIRFHRVRSLAEWRAAIVEHAIEASKEVFLRFNWDQPNLGAARQIIEKMFARRL